MQKLFYEDPSIIDFDAVVTACDYDEQRTLYRLSLDRTAFFPEEGGQAADKGTLTFIPAGNAASATVTLDVTDVQIEANEIYHFVNTPVPNGSRVSGHVDWDQRFDFMQQHTGEHIVSGLIHSHFGLDNVGFHLGFAEVTLDMNGELTPEQLRMIEEEANAVIWRNLPVQISFPNAEALHQLEYRSKLELTENVRIVEIPGVDICACCAPHVNYTGQIGCIKITGYMRHRGGMRINILCGGRALADYTEKQKSVSGISALLSAKQNAVADAVARLREENLKQKEQYHLLQGKLLNLALTALPSPANSAHALLFLEDINDITMRNAINDLVTQYSGYCGIFVGNDCDGYRFIIGSTRRDCRELAQLLREHLQAKGGGSAPMIQGSITANRNTIQDFILQQ